MKKTETDRSTFAVISLWGKFGGLHTCAATFRYIVPLQNIFLTRLFSKLRLKRKDFQEILRLPWAQEASGSNPDAPVQGARHDVLLCRVDRPGEGFHLVRPRSRPGRRPERRLHHFVSHSAKEEGIGLVEVLDRVTMQVFVRGNCTMIAAPVQCDVDGIPKGFHYARVPPMGSQEHRLIVALRIN
jgi:hypothetical protein